MVAQNNKGAINIIEENTDTDASSVIVPKQKLVIEAVSNVWIKIYSDNKIVFEGTISSGSKKSWEADKIFILKIGYAPGIKVFFNDKQVDVVSNAKQDVNTIILDKQQ
ncbi:MAG: DUF4115 domain-containing protein [Endomicrobium sp.]|jgi:cytoskeleton protein RodZ|nr:DUF4115 domain-containing protein [Endomicrobium sp.]